jgi:hypothetical protein
VKGPLELHLGDVVRLRKAHPCDPEAYEWEVVRLGADIGLRCLKCRHRILLPRSDLERRLQRIVRRADATEPGIDHEPAAD